MAFTGLVNDHELAGYYRGATMLVFASLYEGFGLPPLEAMSYGVPVLASRAASIPRFVVMRRFIVTLIRLMILRTK